MAKQQSKRRRKRYQPGSAYAGDVRPTGVLGFMSSAAMVRMIFILMALALAIGGGAAIFRTGALTGGSQANPAGFVVPEDEDSDEGTGPGDAVDVKQYPAPPDMVIDPEKRYVATIKTELGDIQVELLDDQVPETVNNFVFLARDGFYDGLIFHHVADGVSAYAGDPACAAGSPETACRGDGGPGYELSQEKPEPFEKADLGMINGSQFFIALSGPESFAERDEFTPFGHVISGLDVAEQLTIGTEIQTIEISEE